MTPFALSALVGLVAGQHFDPRAVALCRAAIVAGRATVVVTTSQSINPPFDLAKSINSPFDLAKTRCDGAGPVMVAAKDIAPPFKQLPMHFPARVRSARHYYPEGFLRHSHSRYGLYVAGCHMINEGPESYLSVVSLPSLETAAWMMTEGGGRRIADAWNRLILNAAYAPMLPLPAGRRLQRDKTAASWRPEGRLEPVYFDFLVTSAAECELYTATAAGGIECYVRSVLPTRQDHDKLWDQPYMVPARVSGPFAVVPHGKARYLVTPAGAVVRIVDAAGKPLGQAAAVYDKAPVRAVVHDADEDRRYAFTATHYFEVAEPLVLKAHGVKRFDTSTGAAGLETAFHCGRAVRGLPPVPFPPAK